MRTARGKHTYEIPSEFGTEDVHTNTSLNMTKFKCHCNYESKTRSSDNTNEIKVSP